MAFFKNFFTRRGIPARFSPGECPFSGLMIGLAGLAAICCIAFPACRAHAASIASVDQDGGYSGKVLDRVLGKWAPPGQLKGDYQVRLRVSLDGQGKVVECAPVKPSGLEALDISVCAAFRAASPFGTPPYGMPVETYFSFWTGRPKKFSAPVAAQAPLPRPAAAEDTARAARDRARAVAEEAAKSQGKTLAAGGAPVAAVAGNRAEKAARGGKDAGNAAALQAPKALAKASSASDGKGDSTRKYFSRTRHALRNAMYIPVQSKPGVYLVTARIECDAQGNVLSSSILKGSGDKLLDRYVLAGIKRAGKVEPPPEEVGNEFNITFKIKIRE